ncbi:DUF429 domain-containing protein [Stratiformator vulcanicus]|uniref:DUF429 domain-containing protein n=1 Tax=Stratiformator vulcanicus TaxID=2527980 RepID=A0A517R1P4_9PLAN|nr:DUF429 domain-containing protein [Stratiformator vulcanicus]QDT37792.1 hypothetical protein Pan189_21740 [Stratiformator vulcanicus]
MRLPTIDCIYGVDFSGARLPGKAIWIAEVIPEEDGFRLVSLTNAERRFRKSTRDEVHADLVSAIQVSSQSLWAIDFPFGLPIELHRDGSDWKSVLDETLRFDGDARAFGLDCVARSRAYNGSLHIRRDTDRETATPFDCYHYRIIYQTYFGIRNVLRPLAGLLQTAILPFQYHKLQNAERVVVEACPSSFLKRSGLPHQNYKQPNQKQPDEARRRTRRVILKSLKQRLSIAEKDRRRMMADPGGDAIDAVLAAVAAADRMASVDHTAIKKHPRYRHEGYVYS